MQIVFCRNVVALGISYSRGKIVPVFAAISVSLVFKRYIEPISRKKVARGVHIFAVVRNANRFAVESLFIVVTFKAEQTPFYFKRSAAAFYLIVIGNVRTVFVVNSDYNIAFRSAYLGLLARKFG